MLNSLITYVPSIVGALYSTVAIAYIFRGDVPWALVWGSYAIANFALVVIGARQ